MQIPVEEVTVRRRVRQDMGDLTKLMESLRAHGLINPILVNAKRELIAGHRRLEAAKRLGWQYIEATVCETESEAELLEKELDENIHRRNLSAVELAEGYSRLEKLQNPGFFRRLWMAIVSFIRRIFGRG
jgi:ParB family chromosome partitioning protein